MLISIKRGRIRLFFWLPLCALKSKLASRIITDSIKSNVAKRNSANEVATTDCKNNDVETLSSDVVNSELYVDVAMEKSPKVDCVEEVSNFNSDDEKSNKDSSKMSEKISVNDKTEFMIGKDFLKKVYSTLKSVVKDYGHFTLLDVSAEGEEKGKTKVKIKI